MKIGDSARIYSFFLDSQMRLTILVLLAFVSLVLPTSRSSGADPVSISVLLEAPSAIKLIGEYLGVVESLDTKVERILDADFKTAVALFEQAKANPAMCSDFIKESRIYFTRAAAAQSDSVDEARRNKRALALLGLWACCKAEGDLTNAKRTLVKITEIPSEPSASLIAKHAISNEVSGEVKSLFFPPAILFNRIMRKRSFGENDLRQYSGDFDNLLAIQEAVHKTLEAESKKTESDDATQPSLQRITNGITSVPDR